ncbi:MATE family efflux transporter, partial [Singulisphaera rosea]
MTIRAVTEEPAESATDEPTTTTESASPRSARPGGSRELLALALPLVVSQGFMTVQVFLDTILLSWHDSREMAASFPAVMWFWLVFGLIQVTAGYVSTFVAQYSGAGRLERVGPAVWQGIHFSLLAGALMLLMYPAAPWLIAV